MQQSTPTQTVSSTFFEAVQVLRPHPKLRPMSAPAPGRHTWYPATPDIDQCSTSGSSRSPRFVSPMSHPLSAKSMVTRAKELLTPRPSMVPQTPEKEKMHGAFCRTKSVVKSFRRGSKAMVAEQNSQDSLRSGYCSASEERLNAMDISTVSDVPPQIAPLRPVSKFLPDLTIIVPENEIGGEIAIEHVSIKDTEGVASSDHGSLRVAPLRLRSSTVSSASKEKSYTAETSFYTAGETSFYYTPAATQDDGVFTTSSETSKTERPVSKFMARLQDATGPDGGHKTPSIASTMRSKGSLVHTPSSSPKLRHTSLQSQRTKQSSSLRTQFAKAEPAPPVLSVPKMWQLNRKETTRDLRIAPSLERGLDADTLEVFEENATAEAAAIVHVEPNVVNTRRSQSRDLRVLDQQQSRHDMEVAPLNIAPKTRPVRSSSDTEPGYDVSTMPIEILHTIVFSAAWGDAKCSELALQLYAALVESDSCVTESDSCVAECDWDGRRRRLLLQSRLLEELNIMTQYGFLRDNVFEVTRAQIFPNCTTGKLSNEDFTDYIRRAVSGYKLAELRAEEILELAMSEEDEEFQQTSPEDEGFFQREPFNPQGFVYDASSSDECYERLGSLPWTVATFEEPEPEPESQPRLNWRSSVLSKVAQVFRSGRWKRSL